MSTMQAKLRLDYQPPEFTITDVYLTFDLSANATKVKAVSQVVRQQQGAKTLKLDGDSLQLVKVAIDGETIGTDQYVVKDEQLWIEVDADKFELEIETVIDPANNSSLEGLYQSGGAYCTQCEAEGFRRITYFLDRPDVLARYKTRIEAEKGEFPYLLSNGNKIESGDLDGDRHFAVWEDPFPKPSYLFALVAGDFDRLDDEFTTASGRKVALQLFVDKGNAYRGHHAMASLIKSMEWDEQRFGLEYDLDIYMIVAVDFFNMGAMENKGLNVFNSKAVLADPKTATDAEYHRIESIIGHEYFHNWTGNRVTCRDWFQLSLKEGLTVFRDQEFSSDLGSRVVNRIDAVKVIRNHQFAEDAGPMAHPIRPDKVVEMNNFYTVTVYDKGAEVIRMMHTLLGADNFRKGMDLYFERHDGQAVTCDDFVQAMQDASSIDLSLFRRWYGQSGTPTVSAEGEFDEQTKTYRLTLTQNTPATADQKDKLPLLIPVDVELLDLQGNVQPLVIDGATVNSVLRLTEPQQTWIFENISGPVVPCLLREFSAPVKLDYQYQPEQLALLLSHATNEFSRWDSGQRLLADEIFKLADGEQTQVSQLAEDALRKVLLDQESDPAFVAEIITLPSEATLAQLRSDIDVESLHLARRTALANLGLQLEDELLVRYRDCKTEVYGNSGKEIAKRSLKNACLHLLAHAQKASTQELVKQQFSDADNMTDSLAALTAANLGLLPCFSTLLGEFEAQWKHDPLVMDKWFTQVATSPRSDVLSQVEQAMSHPVFDIANPNRVRALVSGFAEGNRNGFHQIDGSGYRFLTDQLIKLNSINPQIAARMITPLIQWRSQDEERQALMVKELRRLAALENLSRDLAEKIEKSLEDVPSL